MGTLPLLSYYMCFTVHVETCTRGGKSNISRTDEGGVGAARNVFNQVDSAEVSSLFLAEMVP